jgi:acyl-CoA hydrolase
MSAIEAATVRSTSLTRLGAFAALLASAFCVFAAPASANSPNPTSIVVNSVKVSGNSETVTVSGTWTWDERVPNGPQKDCNDSRIGVGYAVIWGDNTANPLKVQGTNELVYVGDANDNWVHSVTQGTQTVDGPFKPAPGTVTESMLGETEDATINGFGPQGISTGATDAVPTKADAEKWFSNCGPTAQSVVNGQTIGNSKPGEPQNGFPNGTWGPISHTYSTLSPHKICPVFYDPHGSHVGLAAGNEKEITAGGNNHNGDNSIESNGNKSACVVDVEPKEPAFEAKKEQEIAGSGQGFTTAKLIGQLGQTVDYKITVTDTGNTSLTLSALTDPKCDWGTISAASKSPIGPGESAFYTCSHVLTATGIYTNVGTVTGTPPGEPPITHDTPPVEVEVPAAPNFDIKKEQRFAGEAAYTTAKLVGKVGQTVEYRITVRDTGNTSLTLKALVDPKCDAGTLAGPSTNPIATGESATFTCSHVLNAVGVYTNVAADTVEGGGKELTKSSNEVEVEALAVPRPGFETKKEQRLAGEAAYTTAKLTGKLGQTVEYRIDVTDTGNTTLTLGALSDAKCDAGTISAPSQSTLAPGQSAFYTCRHVLNAVGVYTNVAVVSVTPPGEPPISHETPPVEVNVPPVPAQGISPSIAAAPALKGPQGCVRGSFTATVNAAGVKSMTFYLDGHKLKTLTARNAHNGVLKITINASKLSLGGHRLTAKITMTASSATTTRSLTFVHCGSPVVTPHFTG